MSGLPVCMVVCGAICKFWMLYVLLMYGVCVYISVGLPACMLPVYDLLLCMYVCLDVAFTMWVMSTLGVLSVALAACNVPHARPPVCMYVCMSVCMYVCICVGCCLFACMCVCLCWMHVFHHVSMPVRFVAALGAWPYGSLCELITVGCLVPVACICACLLTRQPDWP